MNNLEIKQTYKRFVLSAPKTNVRDAEGAHNNTLLDDLVWEESCTSCGQVYPADELEWCGEEKTCESCLRTGATHRLTAFVYRAFLRGLRAA
jgi:hypothetical protein